MFFNIKEEWKERTMLKEDGGRTVSYGDACEFIRYTGERMKAGSLMAILCENKIGSVFSYLSALNREVVPLLLDSRMDTGMAKTLLETYRPEYLAFPERLVSVYGGGEEVWKRNGYVCVHRRETGAQEKLNPELALLLTTSGSTGSPKLVRQSWKNIESNTRSIVEYLELGREERPITTLPMHYTYGLSIINSHIQAGACILLTDRTLFDMEFWEFFEKEGATSFGGVPYTYEMLKRLDFFDMDLPSLKTMTQAGGKLPAYLHREFAEYAAEKGKRFVVMYGQTEATARMGYLPAEYSLKKCGSMGIAIPGGKFYLIGLDGEWIEEPDITGELVYEGDNVTLGYAVCREDLKKGDERGGILVTGDMAKRDQDGYYYITGRKKRFLKMFGNRVNMDEVEQMLKQNFHGADFACTGQDDHMIIYAAGFPEDGAKELPGWLEQKTNLNARGFEICIIPEIPKNDSGKTLYGSLPKHG